MTGKEFYDAVIKNPKYKKAIEENLHFHEQMDYLKGKENITFATLINSISYLSRQLLDIELLMIKNGDDGGGYL